MAAAWEAGGQDRNLGSQWPRTRNQTRSGTCGGRATRSWRNVLGGVLALIGLLQFIIDTDAHGFNFLSFVG